MRSLWQLIYRYHVFLLFIGLEVAAIALLVRNNNYHRAVFLHSANEVTGTLYARRTEVAEYLRLQSINEALARENAVLKSEAVTSFHKLTDNLSILEDTLYVRRYAYMPARVINNSVNRVNNYITIDRGLENGIDKEMGVSAEGKVVGIIKDVSDHFASVMPLINTNFTLGVKLKSSNAFGRVEWTGEDPTIARVVELPRYANPLRGDTVVTSGFSSYFPEGLLVGTIESSRIPEGENFYEIEIRLATPFHELSYVDVIHHMLQEEQRALEALNEEEE
jgi:rod shape-determining protein MreC